MAFVSYDQLRGFATRSVKTNSRIITEASVSPAGRTVFLSHSSKDSDLLPGAIALFEAHEATVYIDRGDDALPRPPSTKTAEVLKGRINEMPRFVVLVTPNSKDSRWVPWELGLADGMKGLPPVAILPANPTTVADTSWVTQEYLGLYPRVYFDPTDATFKVLDPRDGRPWLLKPWLHNKII